MVSNKKTDWILKPVNKVLSQDTICHFFKNLDTIGIIFSTATLFKNEDCEWCTSVVGNTGEYRAHLIYSL